MRSLRSTVRHAARSSSATARLLGRTLLLAGLCGFAHSQSVAVSSSLGCAFVVPPTSSTAFGSLGANYDPGSGLLNCNLSLVGINATAAHLHRGAPGVNSPVLFTLTGGGAFFGGSFALDAGLLADLLAGRIYVDAHSTAQPLGEVRGQIGPRRFLHAEPEGQHVVPPVASAASARSWIVLDPATQRATFAVQVKGTTATAVEWRRGPAGSNGPLLLSLSGAGSAWAAQSAPLPTADLLDLLTGRTYLLVLSPQHPGGELRDQVGIGGLNANGEQLSASRGGRIELFLDTDPEQGGRPYLVLGSLAGTFPGLTVDGLLLPLNIDAYFLTSLVSPNQPPLSNSFSFLGLFGQGQAALELPPGAAMPVVGVKAHHALAVLDLFGSGKLSFTANAVPLSVLP